METSKKLNWKPIIAMIEKYQRFVISTHIFPDGDAIGSQMGLYYMLRKLGKQVVLLNNDHTPANLRFLDPDRTIYRFNPMQHNHLLTQSDALIVVDTNSYERIGSVGLAVEKIGVKTICIDHHLTKTNFGDVRMIDTKACAAAELVYRLAKEMEVPLDLQIAQPLYVGLLMDTGSFRFFSTTPETHLIVSDLLSCGVRQDQVYSQIYETCTDEAIRLLGLTLSKLKKFGGGKIATLTVTHNMSRETGADPYEIEGLVNYTLKIFGVNIGILFLVEKGPVVKISLRSKGNYNVSEVAKKFGGGGHYHAAGIRIDKPLSKIRSDVIHACEQLLAD
ncbi:MAG: hypothetical protein B6244_07820 [Candidatus Cloacimonetes bacterium 4572_55]|nr:MAG: hypothetical protein B6244_07820 [Candidatus Cloacimonetes bacterium 4572_55]